MKWQLIIIMFLVLPIVMADKGDIEIYKPREKFDLTVHLTNRSGDVTGANCSIQIRNESYGTIENFEMDERGGGWYNRTHNSSRVGTHYCRYNCTQGNLFVAETCDFAIRGDTGMPIAVVLTVIFVILVYFFLLINLFLTRTFTEHGLIKLLFLMTAFWLMLLPVNIAIQFNDANGGPVAVTDHLSLLYQIMIWLNYFIMIYFFLWLLVQLMKKIGNVKRREN